MPRALLLIYIIQVKSCQKLRFRCTCSTHQEVVEEVGGLGPQLVGAAGHRLDDRLDRLLTDLRWCVSPLLPHPPPFPHVNAAPPHGRTPRLPPPP